MKADQYRLLQAGSMTEKRFQEHVIQLANGLGWRVYHTWTSRNSEPGWPDLVLAHPRFRRVIFRELKTMKGHTSHDQKWWLAALDSAGMDQGVWRPDDMFSGRIERELRGLR